ncbi:MAG: hypothetical protein F6J93_00840 [Oscillatoria sp. SIO1A7]|nr:hypothetical protein [Oscillatoria sp. SIO1A7]
MSRHKSPLQLRADRFSFFCIQCYRVSTTIGDRYKIATNYKIYTLFYSATSLVRAIVGRQCVNLSLKEPAEPSPVLFLQFLPPPIFASNGTAAIGTSTITLYYIALRK